MLSISCNFRTDIMKMKKRVRNGFHARCVLNLLTLHEMHDNGAFQLMLSCVQWTYYLINVRKHTNNNVKAVDLLGIITSSDLQLAKTYQVHKIRWSPCHLSFNWISVISSSFQFLSHISLGNYDFFGSNVRFFYQKACRFLDFFNQKSVGFSINLNKFVPLMGSMRFNIII